MDIDLKRLATDAAYWDEVAPEGASHWCTLHKKWIYNPDWRDDCCIPRPTKPAAPEWDGKGYPPVGCICECLFNDEWSKVAVLAHHGDESWVKRPRKTHIVSKGMGNEFRPIRTKEQRLRDELASICRSMIGETDMRKVADAIIAAGYRKPEDD